MKMTIQELPKPLESTLDTLLMDNQLTSWHIKGGQHFIQVTIRFSTTAIGPNIAEVKYRKASPSQIIRDKNRAKEHEKHTAEGLSEFEVMDLIHKTTATQHCAILEEKENINNTVQVSCTVIPSSAAAAETMPDNSHVQSLELHTEEVGTGNIGSSPKSIDLDDSLRESVKSEGSDTFDDPHLDKILEGLERMDQSCRRIEQTFDRMNDTSTEKVNDSLITEKYVNSDIESVEDGTYTCDGCGGMMDANPNSMWYRCTCCCDIDICYECFIKDIHKHHKAHLQQFTAPSNWDIPYCDACGFSFADQDGTLYNCRACEDYCLCQRCQNKLLHIHHSKHLKVISVQQYTKDIG